MKKTIPILILALLLPSCAPAGRPEDRLTVVCSTYPIYLFASFIAQGVEGVAVERLDTGSTSCLHDYSLSMADMKKLEKADVIALNGAGLEEFLEDALAASDAQIIDCSLGVELLENLSHHHEEGEEEHDGHDHGHWDPHYWMDPDNARIMVENLRNHLVLADPDHAAGYEENAWRSDIALRVYQEEITRDVWDKYSPQLGARPKLITFHDGFQYFAKAFGMELLASTISARSWRSRSWSGNTISRWCSPRPTAPTPRQRPSAGRRAAGWPSCPCSWTARSQRRLIWSWAGCAITSIMAII